MQPIKQQHCCWKLFGKSDSLAWRLLGHRPQPRRIRLESCKWRCMKNEENWMYTLPPITWFDELNMWCFQECVSFAIFCHQLHWTMLVEEGYGRTKCPQMDTWNSPLHNGFRVQHHAWHIGSISRSNFACFYASYKGFLALIRAGEQA